MFQKSLAADFGCLQGLKPGFCAAFSARLEAVP
jgi:hypothetical protein